MTNRPTPSPADRFTILVIGHRGMLGQDLIACFESSGLKAIGLGSREIDVTKSEQVDTIVMDLAPHLVINCSAYTAVDRAESEPEAAFAVNRTGPENLANVCRRLRIPLIHMSTDYVFDGGSNRPYLEEDPINPINIYGLSKWEGEQAVRTRLPEHLIVRTAWLYGVHGHNFVKTMLRLAREREELRIVVDQHGSPTWTGDMSHALVEMSLKVLTDSASISWGTYHYCSAGETTWYDFARLIVEEARRTGPVMATRIVPITSAEYPSSTSRPAYSVLDCTRIARIFGITPRPWPLALVEMLKSFKGYGA